MTKGGAWFISPFRKSPIVVVVVVGLWGLCVCMPVLDAIVP